ncbi:hypothetical protein JHJ32_01475 [Parapedobacter sp. ISTM3]|uniref:hypothetical protein n=1 Tax=Parapedobacter sp. ISTM3 TaxID=2800130 RepID=UPI0019049EDF|nr:hypothetical protein [Parapedobacter sp. ISTM3]MBK1438646.1 hypothetical protein [Parapedobacter sp. ISTM3]
MDFIFTVCSNNYLAQASILANSIKKYQPQTKFVIALCDKRQEEINYREINAEIITLAIIEPQIEALAKKYNIIELNTAVKPRVIEYLFEERNAETIIYLDPDIKLYHPLTILYDAMQKHPILLTPHIYTPIPIDGKKPGENTFLKYGIYNLGFIALRQSEAANKLVKWWKYRTYEAGYFKTEDGLFVDQLPINHVPVFFDGVKILHHKGLNMAPWNLHERELTKIDGNYFVNNEEPLIFYHFSSFKVDSNELPLFHYDRYTLTQRPDLQALYEDYNTEIKQNKYMFYQTFESKYSLIRTTYIKTKENEAWRKKGVLKKLFGKKK